MMPIFAALLEDNKQSGLLTADETGIAFETNSFDCEALVPETDPLYIRTSENEIVSLFNNFTTAPGRKYGPANGFISTQVVTSNAAIFSTHKWQPEDPIRLVIFSLKGAESVLTHFDQVEELKSPKNFTTPKPELFKVVHGGCTYSMFYGVSASFGGLKPTTIEPRLSIEFEQGRDINSFLQDVNDYVAFVSFCSGKCLKPSEILICEKPTDELHKFFAEKNSLSRVVYPWPEPKSKNPNMLQRPFASVRNDEFARHFEASLESWVKLNDEWQTAKKLLMGSLRFDNEFSAERLMACLRWFESTPTTQNPSLVSNEHAKKLANILAVEASKLNYSGAELASRFLSNISSIKKETSQERFIRLAAQVNNLFNQELFDEHAVQDFMDASIYRGQCAHGHFEPSNDNDFMKFCKSTEAVEALCYLLLAANLPLPITGLPTYKDLPFYGSYRLHRI